jgi:hypothetical protein
MSQLAYGTGVPLSISPSRVLFIWIVLIVAFTLILCALYLPLLGTLVMGAVVTAASIHDACRDALLISPESIIELRISHSGLDCNYKHGGWQEDLTTMPGSSFVSRWVSVVAVRRGGSRRVRRIILMPDSLSRDGFRHLRTWLQWSKSVEIGS